MIIQYILTTNENFKCYTCKNICDKKQKEYYLNMEDFINSFSQINSQNIEAFYLIGNEPLLHPNLIEICQIINKNFPNALIHIYTYGILLRNYSDYNLMQLIKQYNVQFFIRYFNDLKYINTYKEQISRFELLQLPLFYENNLTSNKETLIYYDKNFISASNLFLKNYEIYNKIFNIQNYFFNDDYLQQFSKNIPTQNIFIPIENIEDINNLLNNSTFLQNNTLHFLILKNNEKILLELKQNTINLNNKIYYYQISSFYNGYKLYLTNNSIDKIFLINYKNINNIKFLKGE